ncbi:unnamed protein product [Vitrella brassicaformis CCMP3155]|uniref:VLRF1 domain-containing protein n=1 Tax=Vitrella brassicaformis (strain CCMP3155) TaxID=1169540 RepID=A0A0G4GCR6_VITBC|nr:unnamed protein product [Vitrella brassicaformis CCMP3155]|eukprot:CEM27100.1 unnamed protein product [Vitrella brassicaformis CCMP3155]
MDTISLPSFIKPKHVTRRADGAATISFWDLPSAFFDAIRPQAPDDESPVERRRPDDISIVDMSQHTGVFVCTKCGVSFPSAAEFRVHCLSSFHVTNVRRLADGKKAFSSAEWERLVELAEAEGPDDEPGEGEGEGESSSSSEESSAGENEEDGEDAADTLPAEQPRRSPFMEVRLESLRYAFSKNLFKGYRGDHQQQLAAGSDLSEEVCQLWESRLWAVMVLRSGRFAGAIFEGGHPLLHKVITKYTVRRKAGGAQAACDGTRAPKSAGATLRRAGEKALRESVRELLNDTWADEMKRCRLVFVSTTKRMQGVLFGDDDAAAPPAQSVAAARRHAPLRKTDGRLRRVPSVIQRPTFGALKHCHAQLSTVVILPEGMEEPQIPDASSATEDPPPAAPPDAEPTATTAPEQESPVAQPPHPLIDAAKRGDIAACRRILARLGVLPEGVMVDEEESDEETTGGQASTAADGPVWDESALSCIDLHDRDPATCATALHAAAEGGHDVLVLLLLRCGLDPCSLDMRGRVPYFVCKTKECRDAFRRYRAEAPPDRWDWHKACIPEPLTEDLEARKKEKEREKRRRARQRKKASKAVEKQQEEAEAARREEEHRRQTEAREKALEAERLARICDSCSAPITGKPFQRLEYKYCSVECVQRHKRRLMAEAAEKRLAISAG